MQHDVQCDTGVATRGTQLYIMDATVHIMALRFRVTINGSCILLIGMGWYRYSAAGTQSARVTGPGELHLSPPRWHFLSR